MKKFFLGLVATLLLAGCAKASEIDGTWVSLGGQNTVTVKGDRITSQNGEVRGVKIKDGVITKSQGDFTMPVATYHFANGAEFTKQYIDLAKKQIDAYRSMEWAGALFDNLAAPKPEPATDEEALAKIAEWETEKPDLYAEYQKHLEYAALADAGKVLYIFDMYFIKH